MLFLLHYLIYKRDEVYKRIEQRIEQQTKRIELTQPQAITSYRKLNLYRH